MGAPLLPVDAAAVVGWYWGVGLRKILSIIMGWVAAAAIGGPEAARGRGRAARMATLEQRLALASLPWCGPWS